MVQTGLDRFFADPIARKLKGARVGLLAHPASINSRYEHAIDIFKKKGGLKLVKLFGPEHGFSGSAQDMVSVAGATEQITQLPVVSLYGSTSDSLKPKSADLKDVDFLICDLQDIGTRYYTFAGTMALCMKACAENGVGVVVLDRPNPINGLDVEGKPLQKGFESFVGLFPIAVRHGMTIGEMAHYFNDVDRMNCRLHIVTMKGWRRKMYFDETGLPWVLPSPNMPALDTALVYPGMCLLEATNLSEGRGTTRPFELAGAPFIDSTKLSQMLNKLRLSGVFFRETSFKPVAQKWKGEECHGVQLHVTNRKLFKPLWTGIAFLKTVFDLYPNDFAWRDQPYEFVTNIPAIDLLSGDNKLLEMIERKKSLGEIKKHCSSGLADFLKLRKKYLLY